MTNKKPGLTHAECMAGVPASVIVVAFIYGLLALVLHWIYG